MRSLSEGDALQQLPAGPAVAGAAVASPGSATGETSLGADLSPDRSLSPGPDRRRSSGGSLPPNRPQGGLVPDQSGAWATA